MEEEADDEDDDSNASITFARAKDIEETARHGMKK
jgi:hypothetical protein